MAGDMSETKLNMSSAFYNNILKVNNVNNCLDKRDTNYNSNQSLNYKTENKRKYIKKLIESFYGNI